MNFSTPLLTVLEVVNPQLMKCCLYCSATELLDVSDVSDEISKDEIDEDIRKFYDAYQKITHMHMMNVKR